MLQLTSTQQTIVECVQQLNDALPRSGLAKMLAGSHSQRTAHLVDEVGFGRLSHLSRKSILHNIDTLLQQNILALDWQQNVTLPS